MHSTHKQASKQASSRSTSQQQQQQSYIIRKLKEGASNEGEKQDSLRRAAVAAKAKETFSSYPSSFCCGRFKIDMEKICGTSKTRFSDAGQYRFAINSAVNRQRQGASTTASSTRRRNSFKFFLISFCVAGY